jgi:hypothetical protein
VRQVVPTGRAPSLPFRAVCTGPQRTTTDNAIAASNCTVTVFAGDDPGGSGFGSRWYRLGYYYPLSKPILVRTVEKTRGGRAICARMHEVQ